MCSSHLLHVTVAAAAAEAAEKAFKLGFDCLHNKSQFHKAIEHFTTAIGLDGTNYIYYHNRSVAYQKIKSKTDAIIDARKVSVTSM